MRISIIVPTYLRAHELDKYLFPSLVVQTLTPLEILIVDDTPDNSVEEMVKKWRTKFINSGLIYLRNPLGRSSLRARYYGATVAKGELLMFFDSDIVPEKDFLENILNVFKIKSDAVGVQGYVTNLLEIAPNSPKYRYFKNPTTMNKMIYVFYKTVLHSLILAAVPTVNSCRLFEHPLIVDKIIASDWLGGADMAIPKKSFRVLFIDSELKGYNFGEDVLISQNLKQFGQLYLTPFARCRHFPASSGRPSKKEYSRQQEYFLKRLGFRGATALCLRKLFVNRLRNVVPIEL